MLAHPKPNRDIAQWADRVLRAGATIIVPEISDFEVRRSLLLEELAPSVQRLDDLKANLEYRPLTTRVMLRAAELWAQVRKRGGPTADRHALDGDVILAAQAEAADAVVVTETPKHLDRLVTTVNWRSL